MSMQKSVSKDIMDEIESDLHDEKKDDHNKTDYVRFIKRVQLATNNEDTQGTEFVSLVNIRNLGRSIGKCIKFGFVLLRLYYICNTDPWQLMPQIHPVKHI